MTAIKIALLAALALVLHNKGFQPHEVLGWISVLVLADIPEAL